ncbi:dihydrolipoyl dehydrogenase family protein [Albimonas pacifica]|uniref:Pyruvate/2-oxoglutarate dehydrogenase complex, dihydrolipoamide dehydrogenase (E3) component n=1 Tax=Albimonas pacifica TaxID=1114924 RepID=A0A1I3NRM7_9RHOB|nr:FAD-dependent oxidoreductase [Albimonas pacifica]SFJ11630.1 Pyruvate/2-oxoglutarate dehydrogenase complex, dihydrolipoamide dehydrogenase (E3) component [Albimonas pacifica]
MSGPVLTPDLCVIGAGSGGLSAAAGAVQLGASVVLVEGGEMGGDCLNFGCVPSKALLAAGARGLGWEDALAHVREAIATIAPHDSQARFEGLGVTVIRAWARFTGPDEIQAGETRIRPRRAVIATGSSPAAPPVPGLETVPHLTNETLFDPRPRPGRLLILGGGPIGIEMALAHRRLGCAVTVIEAGRALGREDPEAAALVLTSLRAAGVEILEDAPVARAETTGTGVALIAEDGARHEGDALLVAAGRRPNLDRLDLAKAGIEAGPAGVRVDRGLRSTNRRVYAIGDAAGGPQFTHVAGWHGGLVVRSALFRLPIRTDRTPIPRVTYASPELAQAGLTEAEARDAHGDRLEVIRETFSGNDRAVTEGATEGFLKLMAVKGRPVGVTLVGPGAGDLIQPWVLAMSAGLKLTAITSMIAPYPTRGEISKRAAGAYFTPRLFGSPWPKRIVRLLSKLP